MFSKRTIIIAVLFSLIAASLYAAQETKYIDTFSGSTVGGFPKGWRNRPGQGDAVEAVYKVKEEGEKKYLSAVDPDGKSVQIFRLAHWDAEKYPVFKWRWRARQLPVGGNETIPSKNDSACGVYVSFGLYKGQTLKYVWSTTVPAGTFHKKEDRMYIIVKESGGRSLGKWVNEGVNILEDYKKAYGKAPDRTLSGIAILTDGNDTHSPVACDYADFGYAGETEIKQ